MLLGSAYNNSAFQRHHTTADLAIIAIQYIAMALFWPLLPLPQGRLSGRPLSFAAQDYLTVVGVGTHCCGGIASGHHDQT